MHKPNRSQVALYIKRMGMLLFGTFIFGAGMAMFYYSGLGADPVSVFIDGLHVLIGCSYGVALDLYNVTVVAVALLFFRHQIKIGMLISMLLMDRAVDIFSAVYILHLPPAEPWMLQGLYLVVSLLLASLGSGLIIAAKVGYAPMDTVIISIAEKCKCNYRRVRMISDMISFALGVLLGGVAGVGTVSSMLLAGTLVQACAYGVRKYVYPVLKIPAIESGGKRKE